MYHNEKTKTFIVNYNKQKYTLHKSNYYSFYFINYQATFDKDESLYHMMITKHLGIIQKEIKCLKHNKNFIFFKNEKKFFL